jgi:protein-tyrosine-phosphatase/DNA-binding HxlR family transcriptional regulator
VVGVTIDAALEQRAAVHAALGDPSRLAIVDHLTGSDRSPQELQVTLGLPSNLLAHHLDVLEAAGLIERSRSSGDGRRRYVHLVQDQLDDLGPRIRPISGPVLFVCTANSARSQLAAGLWTAATGARAASAGTHPAQRVHPGAVAAAGRANIDLGHATPTSLHDLRRVPAVTITVCDRAHEELDPRPDWLHWSIPDPVVVGTAKAFDATVAELRQRIAIVAGAA